jgi:preprotein translocase subunit SecG
MSTLVTIVHVAVCLFLMLTVLLQSGKGGGMGAAFGGGGSQTVFGGSGAGNFLRRLTVICAALFMITSMALAFMASSTGSDSLRRYAEQQKQLRESMEQTRQEALQGGAEGATTPEQPATPDQGTAEEGAAVEGADMVAPEGTEGADVAPAVEAPATGEAAPAGDTAAPVPAAAGDTAAPGAAPTPVPAPAPAAAPGATQDQPGAAAGQTAPVAPAPPAGAAAQGDPGATPNP